jgi:hypothetical protein
VATTSHVPISGAITTVYNPVTAIYGSPHVSFFNEGSSTLYLGGASVSSYNGFALPPNAQVSLPIANSPIYAAAGFTLGASPSTVVTTALAVGGSVVTVTTPQGGNFAIGSYLVIEPNTPRQEVLAVSGTTATAITTSTSFTYGHAITSSTVVTVTVQGGPLHVEAGLT